MAPICGSPRTRWANPTGCSVAYTVYSSAYIPAIAEGKTVIAFGDYSYYNIGDHGIRALQEIKELFEGNSMLGESVHERTASPNFYPTSRHGYR